MYDEVGEARLPQREFTPDLNITPTATFDIQRFGTYEDQVASHGGSGKIKPDKIIDSHGGIPRKGEPLNISYDGETVEVKTLAQAMRCPFIKGKSLTELADEIILTG